MELLVFYIIAIAIDACLIVDLRGILFSFLLSKRNRKKASAIHKSQKFKSRFSFDYVQNHTDNTSPFKIYYTIHLINWILMPIQYISTAIIAIFSIKIAIILLTAFSAIKLILCIWLFFQRDSRKVFKYDKKYKG